MKKLALLVCLLFTLTFTASAAEAITIGWREGEVLFPEDGEWTYKYTYRYPEIQGEGHVAEEIQHYFDLAYNEMTRLVLPMYAEDPIMTADGQNEVSEIFELTCQNERILSFLVTHKQTMGDGEVVSLRSVVFATQGEYAGDTLTLRGVAQVGESSAQLGEAVLQDVWRQIVDLATAQPGEFLEELSEEKLTELFYPESAFYADEGGNIVFYIQPGDLRPDDEILTFTYSPAQLEELIGG